MKLISKETREIGYLQNDALVKKLRVVNANNDTLGEYNSLAELNAKWEDYEELIGWCITTFGGIRRITTKEEILISILKEIGNYFETEEEAEKAVEKLKAWKRLKDARFEFGPISYNLDEESSSTIAYDGIITIKGMAYEDFADDLDLLFGGEE